MLKGITPRNRDGWSKFTSVFLSSSAVLLTTPQFCFRSIAPWFPLFHPKSSAHKFHYKNLWNNYCQGFQLSSYNFGTLLIFMSIVIYSDFILDNFSLKSFWLYICSVTPSNKVLLEKLIRAQLVRYSPHFIDLEDSLLCSQWPATSSYPEPDKSIPHTSILSFWDPF
jgi:hypothetical protein